MVAKIDEENAAMVTLAVNPARKPDLFSDVGSAELTAIVGAIRVHLVSLRHPREGRNLSEKRRCLVRPETPAFAEVTVFGNSRRHSLAERLLSTRGQAAKAGTDS